ncbi:hypothetical protein TanjilG_25316 [Lupinus angustifolius]|uniref:Membrane protein of ER body-like protein n=1 Tax=Lupinus angustifolius TaxID=3871 RepID=A0A4P1RV68_LUPAN|nr:hypothetical protein TanjilG_25316 [Lupinus angustifolius]
MEVIVDQWNHVENEVEEVVLQRKKGLQRRIDTIETDVEVNDPEPDQSMQVTQSGPKITTKQTLNTSDYSEAQKVSVKINDRGIGNILGNNETSSQDPKGSVETRKKHSWSNWAVIDEAHEVSIPKQHETESSSRSSDWRIIMPANNKQHEITLEVNVDGENTDLLGGPGEEPVIDENTALNKALEIVKSIVYGGLTESLASLTVVTSAASADATILSIVALALANLVGGLFIFVHNLGELKSEEPKKAENQTEAPVDRYNELLGERKNFCVHAFIAILSFIVFGLVPPLVYGFSFHENGDKDFKLAAVVSVSLLCITLLSIAKAYTQKSNTFMAYFKIVIYYVSNGAVGSVLSYLAGDLVKKLLEKVPWLEPSSNFGLQVQGMRMQKIEWSSY